MNFTSRPITARSTMRSTILCALTLAIGLTSGCDYDRTGRGQNGNQGNTLRIQGAVQAAPVDGATVIAYQITPGGQRGATLGQSSTNPDGTFAIRFNTDEASQNYVGPVLIEAQSGQFLDEATQVRVSLGVILRAVIPDSQVGVLVTANITPLTELAVVQAQRATGGLTASNIQIAIDSVNALFASPVDISSTDLVDPNLASTATVSSETGDYTIVIAGLSQFAADLSLSPDQLLNALKRDAENGVLDGVDGDGERVLSDSSVLAGLLASIDKYSASSNNFASLSLSDGTRLRFLSSGGILAAQTLGGLDQTAPSLGQRFPGVGATDVPINSRLFFRATERLDPSTINSNTVIVEANGASLPGDLIYDADSQTIVFTPTGVLPLSTLVTVRLTTGIRDLAGNGLANADNYTFTTSLLSLGSQGFSAAINVDPNAASVDVETSRNIIVTADRSFDPRSITDSTAVTLVANGALVAISVEPIVGGNGFIIKPLGALEEGTAYTVTLSASISDTSGNQLGQPFQVNFVTAPAGTADTTGPQILLTFPQSGASDVASNARAKFVFNEPISFASAQPNLRLTADGAQVDPIAEYFSDSNTLEVTVAGGFKAGVTYEITGLANNVRDLANNAIGAVPALNFTIAQPALTITTQRLRTAVLNQPYSQEIEVVGGTAPFSLSLVSGTLPAGLSISGNSISGTASASGNESLVFQVTDSASPAQTTSQAFELMVVDNVATPTLSFVESSLSVAENGGNATIVVRLNSAGPISENVSVTVTDSLAGSATSAVDYASFSPMTIVFPLGAVDGTTRQLILTPIDDLGFEGDENVVLQLSNPVGGQSVLGGLTSSTVTIVDDDAQPVVEFASLASTSIAEGATATLTVQLSNDSALPVTVDFDVSGMAIAGSDHNLTNGSVTIPAGQTSASISVPTIDDSLDEDDAESLVVTLVNPQGASLGSNAITTLDILDNDALASVSVSVSPVIEGGSATVTVSLDQVHGRSSPVSVDLSTVDGNALSAANGDFSALQVSVSFAAGNLSASETIVTNDDTIDEDDESLTVELSNPVNVQLSSQSSVQVSIQDNDAEPSVEFVSAALSVDEGVGSVTLTVTLDNPAGSGKVISIPFTVAGSATSADHDLVAGAFPDIAATAIPPGTVTSEITFNIVDDNLTEMSETIVVDLGTPTNAALGANASATITVTDNEANPSVELSLLDSTGQPLVANAANSGRFEVGEDSGTITAQIDLSNASTQDTSVDLQVNVAGSTVVQPLDSTDQDAGSSPVRVYIARNGSVNPATITSFEPFVSGTAFTQQQLIDQFSSNTNEGIVITTNGDLVQASDLNGAAAVRIIRSFANRNEGESFDALLGDITITGSSTQLVQPKGLDVSTQRERILVADFGGFQILVFDLLTTGGNVAPVGRLDLTGITGVSGRPWDLDFDASTNRMFVAMTDGVVLVYDNVFDSSNALATTSPDRVFAISEAGVRDSVNCHGIDYVASVDRLIISDVGLASDAVDGKLYVVDSASSAGAAAADPAALVASTIRVVTGPAVRLGNPVDVVFDGANLYVAEKTSDTNPNSVLIYQDFLANTGVNGDLAPTGAIDFAVGTGPESIALDGGARRDHSFLSQSVTIPAGQTSASVSFKIDNDGQDEDNETLALELASPVNASLGTQVSGVIEIQDNDSEPTVNIAGTTVTEGGDAVFLVSLNITSGRNVAVDFSTNDVTANKPADYVDPSALTVDFLPGQRLRTIVVSTVDDAEHEVQESFQVLLSSNPTNATPGTLLATGVVDDNDPQSSISVSIVNGSLTPTEGDGAVVLEVSVSPASGMPVTADLMLSGTSPSFTAADASLAQNPTTLTFMPGGAAQTVVLTINDDTVNEAAEGFRLELLNVTNASVGSGTLDFVLNDDDALIATVTKTSDAAEPSTNASFDITLNTTSEQLVEFSVAVSPDGPEGIEMSGDLMVPSTVSIAQGSLSGTLTVAVVDDQVNETTEGFGIALDLANFPSLDRISSRLSTTAIVTDDDTLDISFALVQAGVEGANARFEAQLSRPTDQLVNYDIAVAGSGASPADSADFSAPSTVNLPGSSTSPVAVDVAIVDDAVNEATEELTVTLSLQGTIEGLGAGAMLSASSTVTDNDVLIATLSKVNDGVEGGSDLAFTLDLNTTSTSDASFSVSVVGNTTANDAAETADYMAPASVMIAAGSTSAALNLTVADDAVNEAVESVRVTLSLSQPIPGFDSQASILRQDGDIADNDPITVSIATQASSAAVLEGSNLSQRFDVSISGPTEQVFELAFVAENAAMNSAVAGVDYQLPLQTSVTFVGSAGLPATAPIVVSTSLISDPINEADEAYVLRLQAPTGAVNGVTLGTDSASASILDDDVLSATLVKTADASEGSDASFTVTLNILSEQTVSFNLTAMGSGAEAAEASDIDASAALMPVFNPGESSKSFTIALVDDAINEADEEFSVTIGLSGPVNGFDSGASTLTASSIISDNDDISVELVALASTLNESESDPVARGSATHQVTLSGLSEQSVAVIASFASATAADPAVGSATSGVDFDGVDQTLNYGPSDLSQDFNVNFVDDADAEQSEALSVSIALQGSPRGVTLGSSQADFTIVDNDDAIASLSAGMTVTEGDTVTLTVSLSGPKSTAISTEISVDAGSTSLDPNDSSDGDDALVAPVAVYTALNGMSKTVQRRIPGDLRFADAEFAFESNQGVALDSFGVLWQASDTGPSIRGLNNIANRANASNFDPLTDSIIRGALTELASPKGIDLDSRRGLIFVANNGGQNVLVFKMSDSENVAPTANTALPAAPWDVDYDGVNDRLFVALTDGSVAIFDAYVANSFAATTPDRLIIPAAAGVADSVNLHGIDYNATTDRLIVSDVGSAAVATDGALYVFDNVIAGNLGVGAANLVDFTNKYAGPATMLGNPVDLQSDYQGRVYVAEKSNNLVLVFDLNGQAASATAIDLAPTANSAVADRPESLCLDFGLRRDTTLNRLLPVKVDFAVGETTKSVTFDVIDDSLFESSTPELLLLSLATSSGPALASTAVETFTINDNDNAPQISVTAIDATEGSDIQFVVRLDAASGTSASADFAVLDGTVPMIAIVGLDYDAINPDPTPLSFAAGQTVSVVRVTTIDDALREDTETFFGEVSNVIGASPNGPVQGTAQILDNDGALDIAVSVSGSADEGDANVTVTFMLDQVSGQDITVEYSSADGLALAGQDYTAVSNETLVIAAGQISATATIALVDDAINEAPESFNIVVNNVTNGIAGTVDPIMLTDNDPITVSITSAGNVTETDGGSVMADFTISLSGETAQNVVVSYMTNDGTAIAGADFTAIATDANFTPGAGNQDLTIQVEVLGDDSNEADEDFSVSLVTVQLGDQVTLGASTSATSMIIDDDPVSVSFAAMDPAATDEAGPVQFQLEVSGSATSLGQDFSVTVVPSDDSAVAATDFDATPITVSFTTGGALVATASVPLTDDNVNEATESFRAQITGFVATASGVSLGSKLLANGTIADNDMLVISYDAGTLFTATETDAVSQVSFNLTTNISTDQIVTVDFSVEEASPLSARGTAPSQDFVTQSGTLSFQSGALTASINVDLVGDLRNEIPETFNIVLSSATGENVVIDSAVAGVKTDTVTITDNDPEPMLSVDAANSQLTLAEDEADGEANLVFILSAASGRDIIFDLATIANTALDTGMRPDFTAVTTTLTIPAGMTSVSQAIALTNNDVNEADEDFTVRLSNASGVTLAGGMLDQLITVTDDDALEVSIGNDVVTEQNGSAVQAQLAVTLNRETEQTVTVDLASADITADLANGDYTAVAPATQVTFAGFGNNPQTVTLDIGDDQINESQETFSVTISNLNVAGSITKATGIVTIIDDDILSITLSTGFATLGESELNDAGNPAVPFRANADIVSEQNILVNIVIDTAGLAEPAEMTDFDFQGNSVLTYAAGEQFKTFDVNVIGDEINEADEQFRTTLSLIGTPDNVVFAVDSIVATIGDDDDLFVDLTDPVAVTEDDGVASFPVALRNDADRSMTRATEQDFMVRLQTTASSVGEMATGNLTPGPRTDYVIRSQTLSFGTGVTDLTFDVTIIDDTATPINEAVETFGISLAAVGTLPRGVSIGIDSETGVIADNDPVTLTLNALTMAEGTGGAGSVDFPFVLDIAGRTDQTVNLPYFAESGGANPGTENADYQSGSSFAVITADNVNATRSINLNVRVISDSINESNQTFQVRLDTAALPAGFVVPNVTVIGEISDDDPIELSIVASTATIDEESGPARVTLRSTGTAAIPATGSEQTFSVTVATSDDVALAASDYTMTSVSAGLNGTPTLAVLLTDQPVLIPVTADTINEKDEAFDVAISALTPAVGVTIGAASSTSVSIIDNDILVIGLRNQNNLVDEANSAVFEVIALTSNPDNTATGLGQTFGVRFRTGDLAMPEAIAGVDYTEDTGTNLTVNPVAPFVANQLLVSQSVALIDEAFGGRINEANEAFNGLIDMLMNANNVQFAGMVTETANPVTIIDNDVISLTITSNGIATEADGGTLVQASLNVNLGGRADLTSQAFSIPVNLDPNGTSTATATLDYDTNITVAPALTFAGSPDVVPTDVTVTIDLVNDDINEAIEILQVALGAATGSPDSVLVDMTPADQQIGDDDLVVFSVALAVPAADESVTTRVFNFNVDGSSSANSTAQAFTVNLTTVDGPGALAVGDTALAGLDYIAANVTLGFDGTTTPDSLVGRQAPVTVIQDTVNEANEFFRGIATVNGMPNNVSIINAGGEALATILDNNVVTLQYVPGADNQVAFERSNGGSNVVNYAFNLQGATTSSQTLSFTVTAVAGTVNIGAGQDIELATGMNGRIPMGMTGTLQGNTNPVVISIMPGSDFTMPFNYQIVTTGPIPGNEDDETFSLTTVVDQPALATIAAGSDSLDGIVRDLPLLNLDSATLANVTPTIIAQAGVPASIAPAVQVVNMGQNFENAPLLFGTNNSGLVGDTISVVSSGAISIVGNNVMFNSTLIGTTNRNSNTVVTSGLGVSLTVTLNSNASEVAVESLVNALRFTAQQPGDGMGGSRIVTTPVRLFSGDNSSLPSEVRFSSFQVEPPLFTINNTTPQGTASAFAAVNGDVNGVVQQIATSAGSTLGSTAIANSTMSYDGFTLNMTLSGNTVAFTDSLILVDNGTVMTDGVNGNVSVGGTVVGVATGVFFGNPAFGLTSPDTNGGSASLSIVFNAASTGASVAAIMNEALSYSLDAGHATGDQVLVTFDMSDGTDMVTEVLTITVEPLMVLDDAQPAGTPLGFMTPDGSLNGLLQPVGIGLGNITNTTPMVLTGGDFTNYTMTVQMSGQTQAFDNMNFFDTTTNALTFDGLGSVTRGLGGPVIANMVTAIDFAFVAGDMPTLSFTFTSEATDTDIEEILREGVVYGLGGIAAHVPGEVVSVTVTLQNAGATRTQSQVVNITVQ